MQAREMASPTHSDMQRKPVRWVGSSKDDLSALLSRKNPSAG